MFTFSPSFVLTIQLIRFDFRLTRLWGQIGRVMAAFVGVVIATLVLGTPADTGENDPGVLRINLIAVSQETIGYKTNNGLENGGQAVETFEIPHLVLYRNDALAEPEARAIRLEVTGIDVPPGGATLFLDVTTRHSDFDPLGVSGDVISVWRESTRVENTLAYTLTGHSMVFTHVFTQTAGSGSTQIATPTDYYDLSLTIVGDETKKLETRHSNRVSPAFLLESQWVSALPPVPEAVDGAAPDELILYYCDMFPFQRVAGDPVTRLPRKSIPGYIGDELAPAMAEAFQIQSEDWSFVWMHPWTSMRLDDGPGQMSVALSDGKDWYHGLTAYQGNSAISINPSNLKLADYASLTDGILSTFYHEVFHNMQRSINLAQGGNGNVGGMDNDWEFFSEGTAVLASSVGQPGLQFEMDTKRRAYMRNASTFVGLGLISNDLNKSYTRMVSQHTAIYWRYLYEVCGGWDIIWHSLDILYAGEVADPNTSTGFLASLTSIMDRALDGSACPFQNYHDSLNAFARSIYGLRLDAERCKEMNQPMGCGFYDPNNLYPTPAAASLGISQEVHTYTDRINSSYGMDFLEIAIPPGVDGQTLSIEIEADLATVSEYSIQMLKIIRRSNEKSGWVLVGDGEMRQITRTDRSITYVLPKVDTDGFNTLALILVRTDAHESLDPVGSYSVQYQARRTLNIQE